MVMYKATSKMRFAVEKIGR